MLRSVTAKLAKMRKPQTFTVYPYKEGQTTLTVQSDRAIGQFNIETGVGVLNYKGSNSKYFMHLAKFLGAVDYTFPPEFVKECLDAQPKSGDEIGQGVYVG